MGTACLEQNAIVEIDGRKHRLRRKITDTCWQLEELRTGLLLTKEHDELLRMITKHQLTFPGSVSMSIGSVNCSPIPEIAKLRRTYVLSVLDVPNSRKQMETAINDVWKKVKEPSEPPGWVSVYRWKNRFLRSKNDIRALVDNASNKGNRTSRYSPVVMNLCQEAITAKYLRRERNTIQQTLEDAVLRIMKENELRPELDQLPTATRRLITRLIADSLNLRNISSYGNDVARKMFRSVKSHRLVSAPLERAEIDHTRLPSLRRGRQDISAFGKAICHGLH